MSNTVPWKSLDPILPSSLLISTTKAMLIHLYSLGVAKTVANIHQQDKPQKFIPTI